MIAAGSTGSMPATATLLATIAKLPHGAVVLPGLDTDLDDATWTTCIAQPTTAKPAAHRPSAIRHAGAAAAHRHRARRGATRSGEPAPHGRERLVSEAMRPAAASELWQERLANADFAAMPTPRSKPSR